MGSGSSRSKVQKFDKSIQMPSIIDIEPSPKPSLLQSSSKLHNPPFSRVPTETIRPRVSISENRFELNDNIEEYSAIWDDDTKLSSIFQQSIKSNLNKFNYHQKESFNNKGNKKTSARFDSIHVESTVDTQLHSCINLSSSEQIDELMNNLNQIHTQLDEKIKYRTEKISNETESILSYIRNETQQEQQHLLEYAKQQEIQQDENYQKLLQEYISKLNEMKTKELIDLQDQLEIYREHIIERSQSKIIKVNEQANIIKTKIVQEEQHYAAEKLDSIMSQIYKISTDEKLQHLGSEIITKTNVITKAKFGTKAPGQVCAFDFDQSK
ncbi:unnamed protein product [Rotaria sordida]|uniref:Uncharacterized protein n=1 Tax=Rotaria sordida TaxID=392033 RepID=A0A813QKI6_9BILA|nr:unnamed protein product [Rotaria sordida]CAF0769049.1 unnamed protein product [Rotaria sordida]